MKVKLLSDCRLPGGKWGKTGETLEFNLDNPGESQTFGMLNLAGRIEVVEGAQAAPAGEAAPASGRGKK